MNNMLKRCVIGAALIVALPSAMAQWRTLSVPLTTQEHSQ